MQPSLSNIFGHSLQTFLKFPFIFLFIGFFEKLLTLAPTHWAVLIAVTLLNFLGSLLLFEVVCQIQQDATTPLSTAWPVFLNKLKKRAWPIFLAFLLLFVLLSLGFLALVLPGIYFCVCYMFIFYIIYDEQDQGIWDAFGKSKELVKPHWWKGFVVFFVPFVLTFLVYFLVNEKADLVFKSLPESMAFLSNSSIKATEFATTLLLSTYFGVVTAHFYLTLRNYERTRTTA